MVWYFVTVAEYCREINHYCTTANPVAYYKKLPEV